MPLTLSTDIVMIAYGLLIVSLTWLVSKKYGTAVNPVSYFAGFYAMQTLVSPYLYAALQLPQPFDDGDANKTIEYSAVYFACIAGPFLVNGSPIYPLLSWASRKLLPREPRLGVHTYVAIAVQFAIFFTILMVTSGTVDWLYSPRTAYQESRAGVGVWWSLSQAMLITLVASFLARKRRSAGQTLMICLVAGCLAYFLASKAFMLFPFVLGAFYYQHVVRPIPRWALLAAGLGLACSVFALQILQGTASDIVDAVAFFEYFPNTATFIGDFDQRFHHTFGQTSLSTLWQYVPRGLYAGKPFVYGQTVIMDEYNPGAGEQGAYPGILPWAAGYLDFGLAGVVLDGVLTGVVARGAFDLLRRRQDMASLLIFGQIGLITTSFAQPFFGAPFPFFWLWLAGEMLLLHVVNSVRALVGRNSRPYSSHYPARTAERGIPGTALHAHKLPCEQ